MPQTCTICRHPSRAAIEQDIAAGKPLRTIADRSGTSKTALIRHKGHIGSVLVRARELREIDLGDSLGQQLQLIHAKTLTLLDEAERSGDKKTMLAAIREARQNIGGLLTLQQISGGRSEIRLVLVKDERDLPEGLPTPVARSDEDLEGIRALGAGVLPGLAALRASSPAKRLVTPEELEAEVVRNRGRAVIMGPKNFGPPQD